MSSVSTITVVSGNLLADGSTGLAEGTTRWTVAPTPAPNSSWFEGPIYTHRIDALGPDMFMVETNTTTWERTLRAVSASGEVDWLATGPGVLLMGDMFGGVVAGVEPAPHTCYAPLLEVERCYQALVRLAGPAGTATWRYDSPGLVDRPAQGPDGTIYVVEHTGNMLYYPNGPTNNVLGEKSVVILDGATGAVTARVPLDAGTSTEPVTVGPIVGGDGFGYLLVQTYENQTLTTLRRLSRIGEVGSEVIGPSTPNLLLPDGLGGLLIGRSWGNGESLVTQLDSAGGRTDTLMPRTPVTTIDLIGQHGTAYVRAVNSGTTTVMDLRTWTPRWTLPAEWTLLAASPDGGAVAQNAAGELARFDGTGQLLGTTPALGPQPERSYDPRKSVPAWQKPGNSELSAGTQCSRGGVAPVDVQVLEERRPAAKPELVPSSW